MIKKIKECVSSRKDENFKIIARSDAKSVEGIDKMIERCKAYIDAGAEIIFPEALHDEKDFEKVRKELSCYLLANMTEFGKTKLFDYKIRGIWLQHSYLSSYNTKISNEKCRRWIKRHLCKWTPK